MLFVVKMKKKKKKKKKGNGKDVNRREREKESISHFRHCFAEDSYDFPANRES